ncbi:MAG: TlpA disulfide reductase family protein, partial [Candidatus Krumholzibacteria bacterium]|nr:TlpA disulfide reductase family protein [Candidatus Krumholzibacteria bacterium]
QRYASAPDVELMGVDGSMARLSAYRGNIVVFSFLATWNKDSARQAAVLNELYARLRGTNFRVFGVFIDNNGKQALQRYMKNNTVNFPAYYNGQEVAARFGGPPRLPTTYVILGDGSIYEREVGVRSVNDLESTLKEIATKRL